MRGNGIKQVASGEIKDFYYRAFDLTSVMERNEIKQVGSTKKNAAAPKKDFASRFQKKDSRTNAKFAILESPSKGGF